MFGEFYRRYDEMLTDEEYWKKMADLTARVGGEGEARGEWYARHLLAELLTRARCLGTTYRWCIEAGSMGKAAQHERLEDLGRAVEMFTHDVEECALRARRAQLFAETDFGVLDADCAESSGEPEAPAGVA